MKKEINGHTITWDETLVHVFQLSESPKLLYIEAVSSFSKLGQMREVSVDDIEKIKAVIEEETAKELKVDSWCFVKGRTPVHKSKYPYDKEACYLGIQFDGLFRHVNDDMMMPHRDGYSKSYFFKKIKALGYEPQTGGSSMYGRCTLVECAKLIKGWYESKLLLKSDFILIVSQYYDDSFETTVGTMLKFLYAKNKSKAYKKYFM